MLPSAPHCNVSLTIRKTRPTRSKHVPSSVMTLPASLRAALLCDSLELQSLQVFLSFTLRL